MKKTFLLMKLLVLCVCAMSSAGAWADKTIFSMSSITNGKTSVPKGGTQSITATFNTGSSAEVYNGHSKDAKEMISSSNEIKLGGSSASYFHATFTTALAAGDVITSSTENTFYLSGTSTKGSSSVTFPYTIKSTDTGLIGNTNLYVWKDGGNSFTSFTITRITGTHAPTITQSNNSVTLTCATDGATIYYTIDGSEPTTSSSVYSSAISLDNSCTIRAFAKKGDEASDIVKKECYVDHSGVSGYITTLGYSGGTVDGDVWTGTNFVITNNEAGRGINYATLAGSQDGFKLNHTDTYTIQPAEGIKVTKLVVVGKTWLQGSEGNASTIAFDGFTPASGSFFDYPTDGETYVKTIEFTPSAEQTYGQAITMRPSANQLGAYIEVYGEIKTYTVTYAPGANGTGSIAAGEKSYGSAFTLSSSTFTRDGYVQTGWATSDGGPQVYALGGSYTANADITLYPVWAVMVKTVTASWDFTNWSDETKEGVKANSEAWSQNEKSAEDAGSLGDGDKGYSNIATLSNSTITYGGTNIPETVGLEFSANAYGVGLIFNLPSTDIGTYLGSQYIWLYSALSIITIPSVPANATIEIGVESHKAAEARGVTLKNGSTTLTQTQGEATAKAYQVCKWTNTSTEGDITITPSKGLHIYYITVTENKENIPVSTATDRNYATCVTTKQLNFSAATGITAYIAKGLNNTKNAVVLEEVSVVPAGTPIIVKTDTKGATVNVPVTTGEAGDVSKNALVAGDGTTVCDGTDGYTYYYIAGDEFHKATSGTLKSGKAYLKVETSAIDARQLGIVFSDSETTGIGATLVNNGIVNNEFFNLQGQRVAQPTKGLYIVNGKKVIMK